MRFLYTQVLGANLIILLEKNMLFLIKSEQLLNFKHVYNFNV